MRIEDVVAVARHSQNPTASKKALVNRWPTRDEFICDAIIHTMLYRDRPEDEALAEGPQVHHLLQAENVSSGVIKLVDSFTEELLSHPRTYLLAHIAPLLPRHPDLAAKVVEGARGAQLVWTSRFPLFIEHLGCRFRPEWPANRVTLSLQVLLDGFVIRSRVDPEAVQAARWESASLLADTVIAFLIGILDLPGTEQSARAWLDLQLAQHRNQAS
ncbi:MAG TPA: hypothetical protein VGP24_07520 [Glaciihabitans sp.]|nr:hypothetical protein [Glaciihabitans sp.]